MGLEGYLKKRFGEKEPSPQEAYRKAQELKTKQEVYEAEKKGEKQELLRQATKRGVQRAKGGSNSGFWKGMDNIGNFAVGMEKGLGVTGDFGFGPKPKKKVPKGTVVHVHVHGGGSSKQTKQVHKKKPSSNPLDFTNW